MDVGGGVLQVSHGPWKSPKKLSAHNPLKLEHEHGSRSVNNSLAGLSPFTTGVNSCPDMQRGDASGNGMASLWLRYQMVCVTVITK